MLVPTVSVSTIALSDKTKEEIIRFAAHMSILGPVAVYLNSGGSVLQQEENADKEVLVLKCIVEEATGCMIVGLHLTDFQTKVAANLMDIGLRVAIFDISGVSSHHAKDILSTFPRTRVGLVLPHDPVAAEATIRQYRDVVGHFVYSLDDSDVVNLSDAYILKVASKLLSAADHTIQIYFRFPDNGTALSLEAVVALSTMMDGMHAMLRPVVHTNILDQPILSSPLEDQPTNQVDFLDAFIGCLKTDRADGMFTTVVCDEHGVCLGLVYSNQESIRAAFVEGKGIYWSRSRGSLWRKGDTSGHHQKLLEMRYDCDRDALRFTVIQTGQPPAFCHLMTRTCWGQEQGLQKLESLLKERRLSAPEGSYTKRLFDDPQLLKKKLLEEVQELVEAEEPDHVAAEAADVIYFMMTRCVAAGVGLREIEKHLDRRSLKITRRPGNAKDWRTKEAERVLAGSSSEK